MPVLPFHRYIGPGNSSNNGDPVDEDDHIARQHDIRYDKAKTEEEVRKADIAAIVQFRKSWLQGNWHSLIGDAGLSIKYFIESYTGVIYPNLPEIQPYTSEEYYQESILNQFLDLSCVFKSRPLLDRYKFNHFSNKNEKLYQLENSNLYIFNNRELVLLIPPFIYVPINWSDLYNNSQALFVDNFYYYKHDNFGKITIKKNVSRDSLKIITKYFASKYVFRFIFHTEEVSSDKSKTDNKGSGRNVFELLYTEQKYIDQDGNLFF